jgi:amino acid adenylation domain-containing protein
MLEEIDLGVCPEPERTAEAARLSDALAARSFDLEREPPLRAALLRLDEQHHWLLLTLHHIACDAWSVGILESELLELYSAESAGRRAQLAPLLIQYSDLALWQREQQSGPALDAAIEWWREQLGGAPGPRPLELPTDYPRPAVQAGRGACVRESWSGELAAGVRKLARRAHATAFAVLLSAWQALLHRLVDREEIAIGTPVAGRSAAGLEGLVGLLVNTVVLRADLGGDPTFADLVQQARGLVAGALAHQEVPFEKVVEALAPPRSLSWTPLFQTMLVMENAPSPRLDLPGPRVSRFWPDRGGCLCDLTLYVREASSGFEATLEYDSGLFEPASARRLLRQLRCLLGDAVERPGSRLSELSLVTPGEAGELASEWSAPLPAPPRETLSGRFREVAERAGERPALRRGSRCVSFRELSLLSERFAARLAERGAVPGSVVAVELEPGIEHAVAALAVLGAGAAVLPLDPSDPLQRRGELLRESAACLLVSGSDGSAATPGPVRRVALDLEALASEPGCAVPFADRARPDGRAWVTFTSGSTGRPRGVALEHGSILARLEWSWKELPYGPSEVACWKTPLAFVDSIGELFTPLLAGVPSVSFPESVVRDPQRFVEALAEQRVSRLWVVPTLLRALLGTGSDLSDRLPALRLCISSGDSLNPELRRRFLALLPGRRLVNVYGSSEGWDACREEVRAGEEWRDTIGLPLPRARAGVFDRAGRPLPAGVAGEIRVGGACLARGYLNDASLDAARFPADPLCAGSRVLLTGDRGRRLPDGRLEFLGRRAGQVKVRGMRLELGEIEALLRELPGVDHAVAFTRIDASGETALHARVVLAEDGEPVDLRDHLRSRLPAHALPATLDVVESLPMTRSGKPDRAALERLSGDGAPSRAPVPPRAGVEARLAVLWSRLLGRARIGALDDFFDLGGHSLLAIDLTLAIERELGRTIAVASVFAAPRLRDLAGRLEGELASGSAVPLKATGTRAPFFCVPGQGGIALSLRDVARHFPPDQPVYGFQAPGLEGERAPLARLDSLAQHYVTALRAVQPTGPYYLGGYCVGGAIAWEMARQLEKAGERVALLTLIDTPFPRGPMRARVGHWLRVALGRLRPDAGAPAGTPPAPVPTDARLNAVRLANHRAFHRYRPSRGSGRVALFGLTRPERHPVYAGVESWRRVAIGPVESHSVAATHESLLHPPAAAEVARLLCGSLERTRAGPSD